MNAIESVYQQFCKERFPLPSERQLEELEQRIGVRFADDYRRFVLEFNGGYFNDPAITPVDDSPREALGCLESAHPMKPLNWGSQRILHCLTEMILRSLCPLAAQDWEP
jgi:hypothetical protein